MPNKTLRPELTDATEFADTLQNDSDRTSCRQARTGATRDVCQVRFPINEHRRHNRGRFGLLVMLTCVPGVRPR